MPTLPTPTPKPARLLARPLRWALLFIFALTACGGIDLFAAATLTPAPTLVPTLTPVTPYPAGTAATFLEAWSAGDYGRMYSLLSPLIPAPIHPDKGQSANFKIAPFLAETTELAK